MVDRRHFAAAFRTREVDFILTGRGTAVSKVIVTLLSWIAYILVTSLCRAGAGLRLGGASWH